MLLRKSHRLVGYGHSLRLLVHNVAFDLEVLAHVVGCWTRDLLLNLHELVEVVVGS